MLKIDKLNVPGMSHYHVEKERIPKVEDLVNHFKGIGLGSWLEKSVNRRLPDLPRVVYFQSHCLCPEGLPFHFYRSKAFNGGVDEQRGGLLLLLFLRFWLLLYLSRSGL